MILESFKRSKNFRFRIRWRLEPGRSIDGLNEPVLIDISQDVKGCELKSVGGETRRGGQQLALLSGKYDNEAAAGNAAKITVFALALASLRGGYGLSLLPRVPEGVITDYGIEFMHAQFKNKYEVLLRDTHGVFIYEEVGQTGFVGMGEPEIKVTQPVSSLSNEWKNALADVRTTDPKLLVSYDLFSSSRFETSSRARFLLLVMAVESMVHQQLRTPKEQELLTKMIELVIESRLPSSQVDALRGALNQLKKVSIGYATKHFLQTATESGIVTDPQASKFFSTCYRVRSRMVHEGLTPAASELTTKGNRLEQIVKELLTALIQGDTRLIDLAGIGNDN